VSAVVLVLVVEICLGSRDEFGEFRAVLGADVLEGEDGSLLLVNDRS